MSTYYVGSGITYLQYLQAKTFATDITSNQQKAARAINLSVARQTRELIASHEALATEHIRAMRETTREGIEQLSWEIQDVSRGISEMNATFQWGFGEMVNQMTRLNSAVSELVKLAKTPVQTEANEHFQIAREALRQRLYPEALEEVERAIAIYKLEWRYHTFAGAIRLGSVSGGLEFLDLVAAEEHFRLAGRYAAADYPADAARALLAAGWAAYCQKKIGAALIYTEDAVSRDPNLAEGFFQIGKVYMALGEPENGLNALKNAIERDKGYALKAAADGDFQRFEKNFRQFLDAMWRERVDQIRPEIERAVEECRVWRSYNKDVNIDPIVRLGESLIKDGIQGVPLWDLLDNWPVLVQRFSIRKA